MAAAGVSTPEAQAAATYGPQPAALSDQTITSPSMEVLQTIPVPILTDERTLAEAASGVAEASSGGFFSKPMQLVEMGLVGMHDATGLPWWLSIALTTISLRVTLLPLVILQARQSSNVARFKPQLDHLQENVKKAQLEAGKSMQHMKQAEQAANDLKDFYKKHNMRPFLSLAMALGQMPIWMSMFFALRDMAARSGDPFGFASGGALWWTDLTVKDPYYGLPVICGTTMWLMVNMGDAGQASGGANAQADTMKKFMKGMALFMIPATSWMQSSVFVYWITSNSFAMLQTTLLKAPAIRTAVGMAPLAAAPKLLAATASSVPAAPVIPEVTFTTNPIAPPVPEVTFATNPTKKRAKGKKSKR